MMIQIVIPHCHGRDEELAATMESLHASDWPMTDYPPLLAYSPVGLATQTQPQTAFDAIRFGMRSMVEWVLYLENDVSVNRHLHANLQRWIAEGSGHFLSLYNCVQPSTPISETTRRIDAADGWGAQGILMHRTVAAYCVANWQQIEGFADLRLFRLAGELGDVQVHTPSLVQHMGRHGTTAFHQVADFDTDFGGPSLAPPPNLP